MSHPRSKKAGGSSLPLAASRSRGIIGRMICQREKDASAIDLIAATINAEAARAAGLVDDRLREARSGGRRKMYLLTKTEPSDEDREREQEYARDEERAAEMAEHVTAIRTAAAEVQRLASDMRANPSFWSLI